MATLFPLIGVLVDFPYEFLTIRMSHLESRLASFFAGGARYDRKIETAYPTWRLPASRRGSPIAARTREAVWMPAKVTAVDAAGRRVTVERVLPPREQMKGIRFWDEAGAKAFAFDPATRIRLDTVRAWLADPRKRPTYELSIDDATDVFVNGWPEPPAELRIGDRLGVYFPAEQDASHALRPVQIRACRLPAGPQPAGGPRQDDAPRTDRSGQPRQRRVRSRSVAGVRPAPLAPARWSV